MGERYKDIIYIYGAEGSWGGCVGWLGFNTAPVDMCGLGLEAGRGESYVPTYVM